MIDYSNKKLDWTDLLRSLSCQFITEGKNCKPGCLAIKCPICGFSDPSEHLVINPRNNSWFCWRNKAHRGRDPRALVQHIGHMTYAQAQQFIDRVVQGEVMGADMSLKDMLKKLKAPKAKKKDVVDIALPEEAKSIFWKACFGKPSAVKFLEHLKTDPKRNFGRHAMEACNRYNLHYCVSGECKNRIVIPLYKDGKIVGWTARAIGDARMRYMTQPPGDATKRLIFNADKAIGGRIIFIHEGPFDAIKVDLFAIKYDCNAVATLGTMTLAAQIYILHGLIRKYDAAVIGFDPHAESQALALKNELIACGKPIKIAQFDSSIADPGSMSPNQTRRFIKHWLKRV